MKSFQSDSPLHPKQYRREAAVLPEKGTTGPEERQAKKEKAPAVRERIPPGSGLGESVFSETAYGAYPVVRDVLKSGAGGNAAVQIADFGIINITAGAFVLHSIHPFFPV